MGLKYEEMYKLGITPWEHDEPPAPLAEAIKESPTGRLLDIGCGTGHDAVWAAAQGWEVTGIDVVPAAIDRARSRPGASAVTFVCADITDATSAAAIGDGYTLLLDIGCLMDLDDAGRSRAASTMTSVAAPGATLLLFAFGEGGGEGRFSPRRMELPAVRAALPGWDLVSHRPADELDIQGPMHGVPKSWYFLVKR